MPDEPDKPATAVSTTAPRSLEGQRELPIVARLVVEVRSDGVRTVARGALEDRATGERIQVQAAGTSPLQLALSLALSLKDVPALARGFAQKLLGARR